MRYIINSLPKAGNNLMGAYLEKKWGVKRSKAWGISSMAVLQPTRDAAIARMKTSKFEQGMIAGIFMPVEISLEYINMKLSQLLDGEYMICHMPNQFMKYLQDHTDIKIVTITRNIYAIIESQYWYIHREKYHPLHNVFNREEDTIKKYRWLIEGNTWGDLSLVGIAEAYYSTIMYKNKFYINAYGLYDSMWDILKREEYDDSDNIKKHVFRKGTPNNYKDTMPEQVQRMIADYLSYYKLPTEM